MPLPYTERRRRLEELDLNGDNWRTPSYHVGDGAAMLKASDEQGLEGVVAKRLDSRYEPGSRSGAWLKIKNRLSQEFVIGGWLPGEGGRTNTLGSLAVGYYEAGKLVYAGNVGTGFTQRTLAELLAELKKRERPDSPFEGRQPPKGTIFVDPELVAEVEFRGWTKTKTLRQPSFKGLRDDKNARDVIFEEKVVVTDG
jgi:bifunctional non-homologous end joining protein LigD